MAKENVCDAVDGFKTVITVLIAMMIIGLFDHISAYYLKAVFWAAPMIAVVILFATANETMKRPSMRNENAALLGVLSLVLSLVLWGEISSLLNALPK